MLLQPEAPASLHGTLRPEDEDDGDLNKALGVQRFQQILSPAAAVPDEQHHTYHEEDIECKHMVVSLLFSAFQQSASQGVYQLALWPFKHVSNVKKNNNKKPFKSFIFSADHRHSSHHIHRPLSKLPPEGRRKKSSKKRRRDKDHKSSHAPSSGPIEEGEDEEEEEEEEGTETTSAPAESERVKDVEVIIWLTLHPPSDVLVRL